MQNPSNGPGAGVPLFPPPPPPPHPPLPPGWEQAHDPATGRPYYANRSTGETSWEPPPYFPPPPPPPPAGILHPPPPEQQYSQQFSHQTQVMHSLQPVMAQPIAQAAAHPAYPSSNIMPSARTGIPENDATYPHHYPPNQIQEPSHSYVQSIPASNPIQHVVETQSNHPSGLGPSTATTSGLLVSSVRAMIDAEHSQRENQQGKTPMLELEGLTAGCIADLCNVTKEIKSRNVDGGDFAGDDNDNQQRGKQGGDEDDGEQYYAPLQPFTLPLTSVPPHIEPGRVDIRLHALHSKLARI